MENITVPIGEYSGITIKKLPKVQTILKIGNERNLVIELDIKFNKLQKFMWKKFFNIEVEDAK